MFFLTCLFFAAFATFAIQDQLFHFHFKIQIGSQFLTDIFQRIHMQIAHLTAAGANGMGMPVDHSVITGTAWLFSTITTQLALAPPALAVIVVMPSIRAVTLPFWSTVATALSDELHVIVAPSKSCVVAVSVNSS